MACVGYGTGVIVCMTSTTALRRSLSRCPVCECITEWVTDWPDNPYYGPTHWCTKCGDSWEEGQRRPRPFARGWRRKAQLKARALYEQATYGPPPSYEEWFT